MNELGFMHDLTKIGECGQIPCFKLMQTISSERSSVHKVLAFDEVRLLKVITVPKDNSPLYRNLVQLRIQQYREAQHITSNLSIDNIQTKMVEYTNESYLFLMGQYCYHQKIAKVMLKYKKYDLEEKSKLITKMVRSAIQVLMTAPNDIFYSVENLFWNSQAQDLKINWLSFHGMPLLLERKYIPRADLLETLDLMDSFFYSRDRSKRMSIGLKFRAIGMLILSLVLEKRATSVYLPNTSEEAYTLQRVCKILDGQKSKFEKYLNLRLIKEKIQAVERLVCANYYYFLQRVFINEDEMSWMDVIGLLVPKYRYNSSVNPWSIHKDEFDEIGEILYHYEPQLVKQRYEALGLGQSSFKLYFIVKLDVDIRTILGFNSFQDFFKMRHEFGVDSNTIYRHCQKVINEGIERIRQRPKLEEQSEFKLINEKNIHKIQEFRERLFVLLHNNFCKQTFTFQKTEMTVEKPDSKVIQRYLKLA